MKKLRIFCAVANINWENPALIEGLKQAGHEVIQYDWIRRGYNQYSDDWMDFKKNAMGEDLFQTFMKAHIEKPFDLFFGYLSDPVINTNYISKIKAEGVYIINYGCNNIRSFERTNLKIAPLFDCTLHAERDVGHKFDVIGAKHLHMPYGVNLDFYKRIEREKTIDVGFIGQMYGYRSTLLLYLLEQNISVIMGGGGIPYKEMNDILSRCKIVVGFRGLYGEQFGDVGMGHQLRGRDFETVAMGHFYLTEYMDELNDYYVVGKEITTFKTVHEFVQKILYYRNKPGLLKNIANAGYNRVMKDHQWSKRFNDIFMKLNLI